MLGGSPFSLLDTGDAKLPTALRRTQEFESRGDVFASAWHGVRLQVVFPLRCLAFLAQVSSGAAAASSLQLFLGYFTRGCGTSKAWKDGNRPKEGAEPEFQKKKRGEKKEQRAPASRAARRDSGLVLVLHPSGVSGWTGMEEGPPSSGKWARP